MGAVLVLVVITILERIVKLQIHRRSIVQLVVIVGLSDLKLRNRPLHATQRTSARGGPRTVVRGDTRTVVRVPVGVRRRSSAAGSDAPGGESVWRARLTAKSCRGYRQCRARGKSYELNARMNGHRDGSCAQDAPRVRTGTAPVRGQRLWRRQTKAHVVQETRNYVTEVAASARTPHERRCPGQGREAVAVTRLLAKGWCSGSQVSGAMKHQVCRGGCTCTAPTQTLAVEVWLKAKGVQ
mmetsp:Transcript_17596/g.43306  ORF Transcript_17596/g.43306 Transcript_17596/m.43306 type:complete len:239 (-) Transcript_17596:121-837(-)